MQLNWILKKFSELSLAELYFVLKLRNDVFVVEQNCVYPDIDGKDLNAYHLMGFVGDELAAYTRLLAPGVSYPEASIGRVLTNPAYRKAGFGKELMQESIRNCKEIYQATTIKIGAQLYLKSFYESFGFVQTSEVYEEDGIDHIEMLLK